MVSGLILLVKWDIMEPCARGGIGIHASLRSLARKGVRVRVPPSAPLFMPDFQKLLDFSYLTTPPKVEFAFFYWFLGPATGLTLLGLLAWFYLPRFYRRENPSRRLTLKIGQTAFIIGLLEMFLLFLRNQGLAMSFWRLIFLLLNIALIFSFLWFIIFYLTTFRKLREDYLIKLHKEKYLP